MTDYRATLKMAIDLMHVPSQVRLMRSVPVPDGVLTLLRIAAGDEEATSEATEAAGRSRETVREAAAFFIEQILFYPDADSYRVLGARPEATEAELRRNMVLLLRWLHPDLHPRGQRSVFAARVTRAWDDLKTRDRRAAYDRSKRIALADKSLLRKKGAASAQSKKHRSNGRLYNSSQRGRPVGRSVHTLHTYRDKRRGFLRQVLLLLFGRTTPW
jgi:hypothetical protein